MHVCLTLAAICKYQVRAIGFYQVRDQDNVNAKTRVQLITCSETKYSNSHALQVIKNICRVKEGGQDFYKNHKSELSHTRKQQRRFIQSQAHPFLLCERRIILLSCTDDCLMFCKDKVKVD